MSCETENKSLGESSQPALETASARSEGTQSEGEQDCTECLITGQNFSFSQSIEVQCSSDKVLVLPTEVLVLPEDYKGDIEVWMQDSIVNKEPEKSYYTKADSQKLENFLLEEQRRIWGNADFTARDVTPATSYQDAAPGRRTS